MQYALVLLALGALLALHELGHLVAARLLGVRVPRFVFGFGPPLMSFRLWGTQFIVGAVPLGGTAHIQGMNPHRADAAESASFRALGPLRRIFIILAGPATNYLVALGILFALYTSGTHVVVPLTVGTVTPGSEAARAQLLPGDRIETVDGQPLRNWSDFVEKVAVGVGKSLELKVERHGESRVVTVRPRADERGEGRIGVSQQYVYRAHSPREALGHAFVHTTKLASEGVAFFLRVVKGESRPGTVAGPGALVRQESSDAISSGADSVLRALVAASVALALLTLLPVPGLDGGRVLLLLVEAASGRRLPPRVETVAQTLGFLAISAGIVLVAGTEIRGAIPERFRMGGVLPSGTSAQAGTATTTGGDAGTAPSATPGPVPGPPVVPAAGTLPTGVLATPASGTLPAATGSALVSADAGSKVSAPVATVGLSDAGPAGVIASDAGSLPSVAVSQDAGATGPTSGGTPVSPDAGTQQQPPSTQMSADGGTVAQAPSPVSVAPTSGTPTASSAAVTPERTSGAAPGTTMSATSDEGTPAQPPSPTPGATTSATSDAGTPVRPPSPTPGATTSATADAGTPVRTSSAAPGATTSATADAGTPVRTSSAAPGATTSATADAGTPMRTPIPTPGTTAEAGTQQ
ncbi:site-2 protease family protein [Myxococcus sp. K15C18031901]|uniref:site-2 protease family protein n=1 Tax=Myxococcus dinghuensis TaxID=2906761 RepID=UPI0020A7429C|nr:site-2 protease family protein [Myxococcus dinghuensis]MCP3097743.1 site-2 protease family protein [Myxococcus dinghuensis]